MPDPQNPFIAYWYYHLPNYALAAIMWTLLGRQLLSFFAPPNWDNYIWKTFQRLTDPVIDLVRYITPRFVVEGLMPLVAMFWVIVLRIVFWLVMAANGLAPPLVQ